MFIRVHIKPIIIMKTFRKNPLLLTGLCSMALLTAPTVFAGGSGDMFKQMDSNQDGRVSRAEHAQATQQMFAKMDANNDGVVTAAEMEAGHEKLKDTSKKYGDKKDEKSAQEKIAQLDTNADGKLTRTEHESGAETMFAKMDADNDGYLSKEECEAGHKMMKKDK